MQTVDETEISVSHWLASDQYRLVSKVGGIGGDFR